MKINLIKVPTRTRKDFGDISALAASLKEIGLLHPVVVDEQNNLIAGERRLRAAISLGWTEIPERTIRNLGDLLSLKAEQHENTCRKDFCPSEGVAIGERLEKLLRPAAEKRQSRPGKKRTEHCGNLPQQTKTRDAVGAAVGMSGKTYEKAKAVMEAAKSDPQMAEVAEEMDRTGNVDRAFKKAKRHRQKREHAKKVEAVVNTPKSKPTGPFDLILADPPWRYEHCEADNREIENQYPTMALGEIKDHKPETAAKDCILFLWATAPKLDEALQVMLAWGFNYRSCAVWDKQKIGMGYWFRIQHELLLVGIQGKPACTPECERVSSIFSEPRTKHSVKPICVYEWIERAFPEAKKLERYQRKPRPGWAGEGNEV